MIWFFIFLVAFFAFFLYGLLRKPAEAGETFWGLFAFWRWFEERDEVRIGRLALTASPSENWFGFCSMSHDGKGGFPPYRLLRVTAFKRNFAAVLWGKR